MNHVILALLLDRVLGEPKRYHPLVGFGKIAAYLENKYNDYQNLSAQSLRLKGCLALIGLIVPIFFLTWMIESLPLIGGLASLIGLYLAIGLQSLIEHARQVKLALIDRNLKSARFAISRIVSRDTQNLNETEIASACVESVLENGSDALFAALFWFCILGLKGVILYRLANTLDAMWGYRNDRYLYFGWAAARFDDGLNLIPARITAFSYAMSGSFASSIYAWKTQGNIWKSPNAGPVMAAGAGALEIELGGQAIYHGEISHRPSLGAGRKAEIIDIERAIRLIQKALLIWLIFIALGAWL